MPEPVALCTTHLSFEERIPEMIKFMERYYDEDIQVFRLSLLPRGEMMLEKHMLYDDWDEYYKKDYIKNRLGANCPLYMTIEEKITDKQALDEIFGDEQELVDVTYQTLDLGQEQVLPGLANLYNNEQDSISVAATNSTKKEEH